MLTHLIVLCITVLVSTFCIVAQTKKDPPPRFAVVSSEMMMNPQFGILDISKVEAFVLKNILPEEKEIPAAEADSFTYSPRRETITQFLRILRRQNKLVLLDVAEFQKYGELIALNPEFFVTPKIIDFANNYREKSDAKLVFKVPDGEIAVIDTNRFWDTKTGVPRLVALVQKHGSQAEVCKKTKACFEIGEAIQKYAAKNGFGLIFDSSKPLPVSIRPFPLTDQTDEFIAAFQK